jgi:hypothetical protein
LGRSALADRRLESLLMRLGFALYTRILTRRLMIGRRSVIGRRPLGGQMQNRRTTFRDKVVLLSILGRRGCQGFRSWTLKSPLAVARVVSR